jgi:hypothetical protein
MPQPARGLVVWSALALCAALLSGCGSPRAVAYDADGRELVEMDPARAAQEALAPRVPGPVQRVDLDLAFPEDGTIFSDSSDAYLAGQLGAPWGVPGRVDAVVVIDTSLSTERLASAARASDRVHQRMRGLDPDPEQEDTILDAELASARLLLGDVNPEHTRLGIVSFSGAAEDAPQVLVPARTEVPLTSSIEDLEAGFVRLDRRGSAGRTHMAAGLDLAVDELLGHGLSLPRDDPKTQKVVVFFTDGTPTLPYDQRDANELAVITAAERAAAHGVRVFSFAVGPEALGRPVAAVEMARRTGGVFTPVKNPKDLTAAVKAVRLTRFDSLEIQNATLRASARKLHLGPDGSFEALVPLKPGKNRIYVRARIHNVTAEAERWVHYAPGSANAYVPPELEERRLRMLGMDKELDVAPGVAQGRVVDVFLDDRREAEARAARQLKELELRVDVASPPPPDEAAKR